MLRGNLLPPRLRITPSEGKGNITPSADDGSGDDRDCARTGVSVVSLNIGPSGRDPWKACCNGVVGSSSCGRDSRPAALLAGTGPDTVLAPTKRPSLIVLVNYGGDVSEARRSLLHSIPPAC